jgi:hypothetical protein
LARPTKELAEQLRICIRWLKFFPEFPCLSKQLAVKQSDIEPLLASLGDKKLVVFIDDLDRKV